MTTGQSITLANSIIGVGILAMPFCFQQCGVLLATLILLFMGLISRLCCYFLLKSALLARRRNFEFLAFHVFGQAGKIAVEVGIIGFLMGTCIAYFVVVGDLGPQIVAKMFNINQSDILRTSIMVIVSLVCVLPLGLLRNVDSLSNVSAATIAFYFCLVMKVLFEAASVLMTTDVSQRVEMWRPAGVLQCVPIFSMALFCQTQLFEIFESLPTLSLEKMNVVTKNAINICTAVYFTLGVFGYIAFSAHDISGNILMSLSPTMASDVIKLGFVMSLAFSFPLIIFPCRASLYSFLYKKVHSSHHDHIINHSIPETTFRCITVAIVAVALFISLLIPNIELVLGLVGSTIGVLICVVFPTACFINVTFKNTNERVLAKGVLVLGLVIMVLGTYANLQAAESSIERYDDKYTQERIDKIVEDFFENQHKDDVFLKSPPNNDLQNEPHDNMVNNQDIGKDSEVQPPNPVPPESQSNEKIANNIIKTEEKKLIQEIEIKESIDKVSETHPRNLKTKLESKLANGVSNGEAQKPKDVKLQSNEDKIDMIKQQKLIETIKQHGEEQKELIKEQKEILHEIMKTKKELQQNKNEADEANEAKKLAVESIKQIADMAIKSIGGVSDKPDEVKNDVKVERLEKLTNDAVQEIAKKAVETIEAIQEIKEKPEQPNAAQLIQNNLPNAQPYVPVNPAQNVQAIQNVPNNQDVLSEIPANPQILQAANLPEAKPKVEALNNIAANINPQANNGAVNQNIGAPNVNQQPNQEIKPIVNDIPKENAQIPNNNVQNQPETVNKALNSESHAVKQHSHTSDEPQSYKQGEDTQAKHPENKIVQNLPLPIVNELANNQFKIDQKPAVPKSSDDIRVNVPPKVQSNGANANLHPNVNPVPNVVQQNVNPVPVRQKREVVDCTKKMSLKPELGQGLVIKVLGTYADLQAAESSIKRYDDKYSHERIDKVVEDFFENQHKNDVSLKSPPNSDLQNLHHNTIVHNNGIGKDSEVQPPNPIPPESQSNEKNADNIIKTGEKNLIQETIANGVSNREAQKPKDVKSQSNEYKIDMMKHQKLIETIKQYNEKQKDLTKEQKEILHEILNTKKEVQQNKNEAEANEAQNIQNVQSNQNVQPEIPANPQILESANLSETKPKVEALNNIAENVNPQANNEVVNQSTNKMDMMQQKLSETIKQYDEQQKALTKEQKEILHEILQSNEANEAKNIQNVQSNQNVPPEIPVNPQILEAANHREGEPKVEALNNVAANENPQANNEVVNQSTNKIDMMIQQKLAETIKQYDEQQKALTKEQKEILHEISMTNEANKAKNIQNVQSNQNVQPEIPANPQILQTANLPEAKPKVEALNNVAENVIPQANNEVVNQKTNKVDMTKQQKLTETIKQHSEELRELSKEQKEILHEILLTNKVQQQNKNEADEAKETKKFAVEGIKKIARVVDCTKKISLKPEDKEICSNLVDRNKYSQEIVPSYVDLNEVALPKSLPLDVNILHHISRSLKSFDKDER